MELMFIFLYGAIVGLLARYILPHRLTHGAFLVPATAAGCAMLLWEILTWAGMKWNGGWIWWITTIAVAIIAFGVDLLLGRIRTAADQSLAEKVAKSGKSAIAH